ncbi:MAG: ADP-ribosylglycohydrolase family protein [Clostridia bacterium]|nr:ADP-ribosylglycohydrolase family protein [Clostridia bacterium]
MLGAIIGDIAGSRFEWHNHRDKRFDLLTAACCPTDDSIMTLAVAEAIMQYRNGTENDLKTAMIHSLQTMGRRYPDAGYGGRFYAWLAENDPLPYNSWGNGSAMRVSPCAWAADTIAEALDMARVSAEVTHNHPEGIKGAEATTAAIWMARSGKNKDEIRAYTEEHYYKLDFKLDDIRETYRFDVSCQGTVPYALEAFLEAEDYEDAVRNAISIGGDSDTLAAIAGSVAEAFFGIPLMIRMKGLTYLDRTQRDIYDRFKKMTGCK